jgi:hypothetical protein
MSDLPTRLLRDALRGTTAEPSSSCVDAATLAAWADGSLRSRERTAIESHAATCTRCQALVAAMARTALPARPRRAWTSRVGWLVPIAGAAAALVLWIAVPGPRVGRPALAPLSKPALPSAPTSPVASASPAPMSALRETGAPPPPTAADRVEPSPSPRAAAAPQRQQAPAASTDLRDAARPAQPPAPSEARIDPSALAGATESTAQAKPSEADSRQVAPAAPAFNSALTRSVVQSAAKTASASAFEIVSPDPKVRWRISGASVQHTVDAGTTWQTQSSGVRASIASGTAPSSSVCWVVGAAGTVARSTDGQTWEPVAFPERVDLSAVRASDAAHASVTATDGRTFTTADGGQTWQIRAR